MAAHFGRKTLANNSAVSKRALDQMVVVLYQGSSFFKDVFKVNFAYLAKFKNEAGSRRLNPIMLLAKS